MNLVVWLEGRVWTEGDGMTHLLSMQDNGLLATLDNAGEHAEGRGHARVGAGEADSAIGEDVS